MRSNIVFSFFLSFFFVSSILSSSYPIFYLLAPFVNYSVFVPYSVFIADILFTPVVISIFVSFFGPYKSPAILTILALEVIPLVYCVLLLHPFIIILSPATLFLLKFPLTHISSFSP